MGDNGTTMDTDPMDLSLRRIVITEDEDLNLDKLLLGDNSGAAAVAPPPSPPRAGPRSSSPPTDNATAAPGPAGPILAREEDEDECEEGHHWYLPPPARPGDYLSGLNGPLHRVPSKSILKKTSSYGNFDASMGSSKTGSTGKKASFLSFRHLESSSSSHGSARGGGRRDRVASGDGPLDASLSGGMAKMAKKTSFLGLGSLHSGGSEEGHNAGQGAIGLDLDASPSPHPGGKPKFLIDAPPPGLPGLPSLAADGAAEESSDADRAAGTARIKRNVSFHSVDVREYDRTVGDNPACRSGPPISLDWSYSKKCTRDLEEYELERSSERVPHLRKLHVNKWKRRNMLSLQWGLTEDELREARRGTRRVRRQRSVTQTMMPVNMAEEAVIGLRNLLKKKIKKGDREKDADCMSDMSQSVSTEDSSHRNSNFFHEYDGLYGQAPPRRLSFPSTQATSTRTI